MGVVMSKWKGLIIDTWWKAVLILGVLSVVGASIFNIEFIERKHLFGFGLGLIAVGISLWMAWKTASTIAYGGILSTKIVKHNFVSIIILIIGIGLIGLFGFLIVKGLI